MAGRHENGSIRLLYFSVLPVKSKQNTEYVWQESCKERGKVLKELLGNWWKELPEEFGVLFDLQ